VGELNRALGGWANYFNVGSPVKAYRAARQLHSGAVAPVAAVKTQGQATPSGTYPLSHLYGYFRSRTADPSAAAVRRGLKA